MDFQNDGTIEYSHPITGDDFRTAHYYITPPTWYDSVRFFVRKVGSGRAVLAQIMVFDNHDGKCVEPPIDLGDRPKGAPCETDRECLSDSCSEITLRHDIVDLHVKSCGGCKSHSDCTADQVCGLEYGSRDSLYQDCGLPERHQLGERCVSDEECTTSICCEGACSECCGEASCPAGSLCEIRDLESLGAEYDGQMFPYQCSPGTSKGLAGAPCLLDDDCESNQCQGVGQIRTCFLDGRKCLTDQDCPSLWPSSCLPLGIAGGECQ